MTKVVHFMLHKFHHSNIHIYFIDIKEILVIRLETKTQPRSTLTGHTAHVLMTKPGR